MAKKSYSKKFIVKRKWKGIKKKKGETIVRCVEISKYLEIARTSGSSDLSNIVNKKIYKAIEQHRKTCARCQEHNEHSLNKV